MLVPESSGAVEFFGRPRRLLLAIPSPKAPLLLCLLQQLQPVNNMPIPHAPKKNARGILPIGLSSPCDSVHLTLQPQRAVSSVEVRPPRQDSLAPMKSRRTLVSRRSDVKVNARTATISPLHFPLPSLAPLPRLPKSHFANFFWGLARLLIERNIFIFNLLQFSARVTLPTFRGRVPSVEARFSGCPTKRNFPLFSLVTTRSAWA
jgi:hypothetical protein